MTDEDRASLWREFSGLMRNAAEGKFEPSIYYKKEDGGRRGAPAGYAAVSLRIFTDFGSRYEEVRFDSMSELLEVFYDQKNEVTRIRQKSVDLRHVGIGAGHDYDALIAYIRHVFLFRVFCFCACYCIIIPTKNQYNLNFLNPDLQTGHRHGTIKEK